MKYLNIFGKGCICANLLKQISSKENKDNSLEYMGGLLLKCIRKIKVQHQGQSNKDRIRKVLTHYNIQMSNYVIR